MRQVPLTLPKENLHADPGGPILVATSLLPYKGVPIPSFPGIALMAPPPLSLHTCIQLHQPLLILLTLSKPVATSGPLYLLFLLPGACLPLICMWITTPLLGSLLLGRSCERPSSHACQGFPWSPPK